jgi:hypothetical protein
MQNDLHYYRNQSYPEVFCILTALSRLGFQINVAKLFRDFLIDGDFFEINLFFISKLPIT